MSDSIKERKRAAICSCICIQNMEKRGAQANIYIASCLPSLACIRNPSNGKW